MKNRLLILLFLTLATILNSQIKEVPSDKAVVYFVRVNSIGSIFKFRIFDGDQIIAKLRSKSYFRYECSPGEHVFWGKAETSEFTVANLEAGKIYIIDMIPQIGLAMVGLRMQPVEPGNYNMKRILKILHKPELRRPTEEELNKWQKFNETQIISNGLKAYEYQKKAKKVSTLKTEWHFKIEDLSLKK